MFKLAPGCLTVIDKLHIVKTYYEVHLSFPKYLPLNYKVRKVVRNNLVWRRLKQKDHCEFDASLGYIAHLNSKIKSQTWGLEQKSSADYH